MRLSDLDAGACEAAFRAWRAGSGALLPYVRSTPFVSLARFGGDLALPEAAIDAPAPLPETAAGELLVLDLPGAACLQAGLALWTQRRLWPVLTFSHWYHPHGMVGDAAAAALLLLHPPAPEAEPRGWCLLLDSERYSDQPLTPERFNNQYELTEDDLPTAEELRHLGLSGVCLAVWGEPKEDLRRYAAYLNESQLAVRWWSM